MGNKLGLAFQIIDDILDYEGDSATAGKTLGTDLDTAKPTLPILFALRNQSDADRAAWIQKLSQGGCDHEQVTHWLQTSGALDECNQIAKSMIDEALEFTGSQDSEVAAAFTELGQFLLKRSH